MSTSTNEQHEYQIKLSNKHHTSHKNIEERNRMPHSKCQFTLDQLAAITTGMNPATDSRQHGVSCAFDFADRLHSLSDCCATSDRRSLCSAMIYEERSILLDLRNTSADVERQ